MAFQTHALTRCLKDANVLKQRLSSPIHCNHPPEVILPLRLPSSKDILSRFDDSLLPPEVLKHCEVTLLKLEAAIHRNYEAACRGLHSVAPSTPDQVRKFQHACESLYDQVSITPVCNLVIAAKQKIDRVSPETPKGSPPNTRTRFRQEYVPLLEDYFRTNAYPSHLDRAYLARKTKMSDRQIEVWFQNHRNRARKDGRTLQRPSARPSLFVPAVEKQVNRASPDLSGYESEKEGLSRVDLPTRPCSPLSDPFNVKPPLDAFPTRYSEAQRLKKLDNFNFSPDYWIRKPTSIPHITHIPVTVDELAALFAKQLSLRDAPNSKQTKRDISSFMCQKPWFAATTTIAPRAPHFAFVRPRPDLNRTAITCHFPENSTPPTPRFSSRRRPFARGVHNSTQPLCHIPCQPRHRRHRVISLSSSSTDESSSELITPPSSPPIFYWSSQASDKWLVTPSQCLLEED